MSFPVTVHRRLSASGLERSFTVLQKRGAMRNGVVSACLLICVAAMPAAAQESDAAQPRPSAPIFSLPPGDPVDPESEPDVQGPRAPGESAPRRIVDEEPQPVPARPPVTANQPQPVAPSDSGASQQPGRQAANGSAASPPVTSREPAQTAPSVASLPKEGLTRRMVPKRLSGHRLGRRCRRPVFRPHHLPPGRAQTRRSPIPGLRRRSGGGSCPRSCW